jgi:hypothetical protein
MTRKFSTHRTKPRVHAFEHAKQVLEALVILLRNDVEILGRDWRAVNHRGRTAHHDEAHTSPYELA